MKRTVSFFVSLLVICSAMFTSCDSIKSLYDKFDKDVSEDVEGVTPDPYELDEDVPYVIEYTSNGDGTCSAASIKFNSSYRKEYVLEIPEESPMGDKVVAIDWGEAFDDVSHSVPKYIVSDVFEAIEEKIEDGDYKSEFLVKKMKSYYVYQDPDSQPDESIKEEILKMFPVTQHMPIYVLDSSTSGEEKAELVRLFDEFYDINIEFKEYSEFCAKLKEKGLSDEEIAELYEDEPIPQHGNYSTYATSVCIPSTISSIGENCFKNLTVRSIVVDENFSLEQLIELDGKLPKEIEFNIYCEDPMGTFDIPETLKNRVLFYSEVCPQSVLEREKTWGYDDNGLRCSWDILDNGRDV